MEESTKFVYLFRPPIPNRMSPQWFSLLNLRVRIRSFDRGEASLMHIVKSLVILGANTTLLVLSCAAQLLFAF